MEHKKVRNKASGEGWTIKCSCGWYYHAWRFQCEEAWLWHVNPPPTEEELLSRAAAAPQKHYDLDGNPCDHKVYEFKDEYYAEVLGDLRYVG